MNTRTKKPKIGKIPFERKKMTAADHEQYVALPRRKRLAAELKKAVYANTPNADEFLQSDQVIRAQLGGEILKILEEAVVNTGFAGVSALATGIRLAVAFGFVSQAQVDTLNTSVATK